MTSKLILLMQRYRGWRVIAVTGIVILLAVELTASAVEYGINGVVHADTWVIALVVAGIVAPLSLGFLAEVLKEIAKAQQHSLEASVRRAETRLEMAIEAAQMVFWELDFVTGELRFNDAKEHWLGIDSLGEAHTIPSWLNTVHPDDQAPFMEHFQRALLPDNAGFDFEYRVKKIGGGWIWVQSRGNVVHRSANNEPLLAAGGSLNIDARKMAELALGDINDRLQNIFNDNPDLMLISRLSDGLITEVNDTFVKVSGYSKQEAIGNTTIGLGLWSDVNDRQRMTKALIDTGRCEGLESEFTTKDGIKIIGSLEAVTTHLRGVPHILCTVRDISARKRAEEQLQQSEALLRSTLESTDEGILMVGEDGHILSANQRFLELWRVPKELASAGQDEPLLAHVLDQLNDPDAFLSLVRQIYQNDNEAQDTLTFKDGRTFARFTRALNIGDKRGRIWCFKDISEQAKAQAELAAREEIYRAIVTHANEGVLLFDPTTQGFIEFNDAMCEGLGYSQAEFAQLSIPDIQAEHDGEQIRSNIHTILTTGSMAFETLHRHRDGSLRNVHVSSKTVHLHGRSFVVTIITDITERKRAQLALQASEEKLRIILDSVDAYIYLKDINGRYLFANRPVRELWGASMAEIVGFGDEKFFDAATAQTIRNNDSQVLLGGETITVEETNTVPATGLTATYLSTKLPLRSADGSIYALCGISTDITIRINAEVALRESEARAQGLANLLRLITDNVPDMIWAKDLESRYLFANKAICEQLLNASDTDEPIGKDDMFFALRERNRHPENPQWHTFGELCQDSDMLTLQNGKPSQFDEYGNVQGKFLFLDVHKAPFVNNQDQVVGVVGSARDVTAQKSVEEKLRLAALVLDNSSEAMLVTDADNRIVDVNPAFTKLTGYTSMEVMGKDPSLLQSGKHLPDFYLDMWRQIETTGHWQGEVWNRRKNGDLYVEWLTINTIRHANGTVNRRVAMFSDITEKKKSEELIWMHANFDQLTLLPNRRMFHDRLVQDLKKANRAGLKLALMFLDLDRFKEVNDTLGHDTGDALLVEASKRIVACVRESDTVARLGGDEFTIILADLDDPSCVERIAEAVLLSLVQPFELGKNVAYISASIGITLYPDDAITLEDMLKNADQAMYVAKSSGRNRFSYFTSAMQESAQYRLLLLNDLRNALPEQQLQLFYQPIVELQTGRIHKAEALLRWFHPKRGLINPADFIPLAEDSGLIFEIGDWVFAQAVQQTQAWLSRFGSDFQVTINKSPLQIQSKADRCDWQQQLRLSGLSGQNFIIEITEGLLLDTTPEVASELLAFRDAGIQVAIDDFGTGYSSLAYLKKLDIDYIKIDQSFIRNLSSDSSDMALAEAIVVMAHKLGLKVVAEGVETSQQRDFLLNMGCDYAQGFLYSRPLPANEFESMVARSEQHGVSTNK